MAVHIVRPTTSYRVLELGGTVAVVGVVAASYAALSAVAAVPLGRTIDRIGPKRFFVGGITVAGSAALLAATAINVTVLILAQALLGLGQISAAIAFQTLTAHRSGPSRERGFARLAAAGSIGQMIGPALAGVLIESDLSQALTYRTTAAFVAATILAAASVVIATRVGKPSELSATPEERSAVRERPTGLLAIARRRGMPQALLASVAVLTSLDLMIAYLPVIGEHRGISPAVIGTLLSLRAAASLASRLSLTKVLDYVGRRPMLVGSMGFAGLAMLAIAFTWSPVILGLLMVVIGYGLGVGTPLTMAWVSSGVPAISRGTALALRMTGNRIGQVSLPIAVGAVANLVGPAIVFVIIAMSLVSASSWVLTGPRDWATS